VAGRGIRVTSGRANKMIRSRKFILYVATGFLTLCFALAAVLCLRWPFRRAAVLQDLAEASLTRVSAASFHETYFPRPGCELDQVIFQHNPAPGSPPLITIARLRIESTFAGLFTHQVRRIRAEGMRLLAPAPGSAEKFEVPERSSFVIDELIADGAVLEIASNDHAHPPLSFSFHNFSIDDVGGRGASTFRATLSNPEPPGEITTTGKFGPWSSRDVGQTPVSGEYKFEHADLGALPGIHGLLASQGKFSGVLQRIQVDGETEVPEFAVTGSSHRTLLRTEFQAEVNAQNGDTLLHLVNAHFRQTTIRSQGSVAGNSNQPGKAVSLEIASSSSRIQDILLLFIESPRAPMSGQVRFKGTVAIPPDQRAFLSKLRIEGDFGIDDGGFTKPGTQRDVNRLSAGALGEKHDPPEENEVDSAAVLSDLSGHVSVRNGAARFSNLSFSVPGALAQFQGTYNLISEKIDLHGTLKTRAEVAKTTQGMKAVVLKVLQPFFRKPAGYMVPVKITGTYDHPFFGLDLVGKEKQSRAQK
jgi:hypothetical protein